MASELAISLIPATSARTTRGARNETLSWRAPPSEPQRPARQLAARPDAPSPPGRLRRSDPSGALDPLLAAGDQLRTQPRIVAQAQESLQPRLAVPGRGKERGITTDLGQAGPVGDDHGTAQGHGLHDGQAEPSSSEGKAGTRNRAEAPPAGCPLSDRARRCIGRLAMAAAPSGFGCR